MTNHLAFKHDSEATWHECPHCDHKSKRKSDLKRHLVCQHNISVKSKNNKN